MKEHYSVKKNKGQLIVFGVLIFPVIFFCLAMVINIGMVVHDKINLQNSVDLAAIYAAQRQAEVMDAMAHINYQMRQSYKLFAWRYLVLGNSGGFVEPTIDTPRATLGGGSGGIPPGRGVMNILRRPVSDNIFNGSLCPNANDQVCRFRECADPAMREQCPYAVCTVHPLFHAPWYGDNTHICQDYMYGTSARALPPVTQQGGIMTTPSILANQEVREYRQRLVSNCSDVGLQNWIVATSMYLAFFQEQHNRKKFIEDVLFNRLIKGRDIDDKAIETGVSHTVRKNLTYINYRGFHSPDPPLTFNVVYSQTGGLPVSADASTTFETFYQWDEIVPIPFYVQNINNNIQELSDTDNTFCETNVQSIFQCDPAELPPLQPRRAVQADAMADILNHRPDPNSMTWCNLLKDIWRNGMKDRVLGFYKKQSPHLGVQVEVEIPYKGQLFFPFFVPPGIIPMTLKAVAYAKPFGASFGPSDPEQQDPLVPRLSNSPTEPMLFPNYSRFPDDRLGLTDGRVQWAWNMLFMNGILAGGDHPRNVSKEHGRTFDNYSDFPDNINRYKDSMVLHLREVSSTSTTTSVVVESSESFNKRMRIYEEMAIAPDRFDRAYYTILPNYMVTLYPRLKKTVVDYVPADLGHFHNSNATLIPQPGIYTHRGHDPAFRLNYIERQIIYTRAQPGTSTFNSWGLSSIFGEYKVENINGLLTSWAPERQGPFAHSVEMYNSSSSGDCELDDRDVRITFSGSSDPFLDAGLERKMIPSHCLKGGRTGFSVKLIHPSALSQ